MDNLKFNNGQLHCVPLGGVGKGKMEEGMKKKDKKKPVF